MAIRKTKVALEIFLVRAQFASMTISRLPKSRNLLCVDLIWPRTGVARKSAAREVVFNRGKADFSTEPWAKRLVFREEIEGHSALAVSVTESITVQKLRRFARLTAKYTFRMGADFMEKAMVGYADIASAPMDALSQMVGEKDAPETIAQGVIDITDLPAEGSEKQLEISLIDTDSNKPVGTLTFLLRA